MAQLLTLRRVAVGAIALVLSGLIAPPAAHAAANPTPSLFVQLSTWGSPQSLADQLADACVAGTREIVFTDVATATPDEEPVLLMPLLERVLRFFPGAGGSGCTFPRVFVGTVDLTSYAPGNPYADAMLDGEWTAKVQSRSLEAARLFAQFVSERAGDDVEWDWYVSYEGMLNYLGSAPRGTDAALLADAWRAYLCAHLTGLDAVHRSENFLWSPGTDAGTAAFIGATPQSVLLSQGLRKVTGGVAEALARSGRNDPPSGPLIIDLQDHIGSMDCWLGFTPLDAASWWSIIRPSLVVQEFRMNIELFRHADTSSCSSALQPAYRSTVEARADYYRERGIPIGASFELRFWSVLYSPRSDRARTVLTGADSRALADTGGSASLTATLADASGGALPDEPVSLLRCDAAWGSCVPVPWAENGPRTARDGSVTVTTPPLEGNAYFRLSFLGDAKFLPADGPAAVVYVADRSGAAVSWSDESATPAAEGEASVIEAKLTVAGSGWGMGGARAVLVQCGSPSDCSDGVPVAEAEVREGARLTATTPVLSSAPAFFQLRFMGDGAYAAADSRILSIGLVPTAWTEVQATHVAIGEESVISGTLSHADGGAPIDGAAVVVDRCDWRLDCTGAPTEAVGRTADGGVQITTRPLETLPAYFRLRFEGDGRHRPATSSLVAVRKTTGLPVTWADARATSQDDSVRLVGRLAVAGYGWSMDGAAVVAERCESAGHCDRGEIVAVGWAGAGGVASLTLPESSVGGHHFRLRFLGNNGYAAEDTEIMTVQLG